MNYTLKKKKKNQGKGKEKVNNLWFSSSRGRLLWEPQNKLFFTYLYIYCIYNPGICCGCSNKDDKETDESLVFICFFIPAENNKD